MKPQDPSAEELASFFEDLSKEGKPAILSLVPKYSDRYVPLCEQGVLPPPLTNMFKADYMQLSYPELLKECEEVFTTSVPTLKQCESIEERTRGQSACKIWFQQRAGRVTASNFKSAACTNPAQVSHSLVLSICYPGKQFFSIQTTWGKEHEPTIVRDAYIKKHQDNHEEFQYTLSGLVLYPCMGAIPDGIQCSKM